MLVEIYRHIIINNFSWIEFEWMEQYFAECVNLKNSTPNNLFSDIEINSLLVSFKEKSRLRIHIIRFILYIPIS